MPQQTNLSVANASAVNKTFTAISPGAFGVIAEWALKEGVVPTIFPRLSALANRTANASNKLVLKLTYPSSYVDAASGLTKPGTSAYAEVRVSMPDAFPEAMRDDFAAYLANTVATALVKSMVRDGVNAT